jgi:hypothetical protein
MMSVLNTNTEHSITIRSDYETGGVFINDLFVPVQTINPLIQELLKAKDSLWAAALEDR